MELRTLEHFSGHVNDTFSAVLNDDEVPFQLVEARALPSTPGATRKPFALLFRNGSSFLFPQQIYRMRHARLGEVGIFLVPVAREREGFLYQALFNCSVGSEEPAASRPFHAARARRRRRSDAPLSV